jgi:hypothetical protein
MLAYDLIENRLFEAKSDRNSVFFGRDPHIRDRLYKTVPHMSCYWFLKKSNFRSKFMCVSVRFYRKSPVWTKTDRNSVFYWFLKHSNFTSKFIGVILWFYRKS